MLYSLARSALFLLDPESAHKLALHSLDVSARLGLPQLFFPTNARKPIHVMGLQFPHAVGLAAGFDKDGAHIDGLASLGFSFLEIGTVTPRAQPGNPPPRIFRLLPAEALINRLGFNNLGVDNLLVNLSRTHYRGILGINIGKNFDTPNERAAEDYLYCMRKIYLHASYITINISSPNTQSLRDLQSESMLAGLLDALKNEQAKLSREHAKHVPIVIKLAPDLTSEAIINIAKLLLAYRVEGVIATNTTTSREGVAGLTHAQQQGGLSGRPLKEKSNATIRALAAELKGQIPIIGVGGIMCGADAVEKLAAGASLVQLYTGLIFRGPELVKECVAATA